MICFLIKSVFPNWCRNCLCIYSQQWTSESVYACEWENQHRNKQTKTIACKYWIAFDFFIMSRVRPVALLLATRVYAKVAARRTPRERRSRVLISSLNVCVVCIYVCVYVWIVISACWCVCDRVSMRPALPRKIHDFFRLYTKKEQSGETFCAIYLIYSTSLM
jgi:hypothetical protein